MKIIYVAGPYSADTDWRRKQNIQRAEHVAAQLWKMGYYAICPHLNSAFFGGICPERVFLEGGLEMLRRSDAMILVKGWESSRGTLLEIAEAEKKKIPYYHSLKEFRQRFVTKGKK